MFLPRERSGRRTTGEGTITGAEVQRTEQADDEGGRSLVARLRAWLDQTYAGQCVERTLELRAFDRGLALASRAFVALLPLAIVLTALSPAARDGGFAGGLIDRFELEGKGADAVRQLFATPSEVKGGVTAFGILVMLYSVYSFARLLARTYEAAWHLPKAGVGGAARGLLWVLELALYVSLLSPIRRAVDDNAGNVVSDVVSITLTTLVWLVTPYLLLAGRVRYRALLPTALLTAVSLGIASAVSVIYMPNAITTSAERYGLVGVAFTFVSWLIGISVVVVVAAAIGAVTAERYLSPTKGTLTGMIGRLLFSWIANALAIGVAVALIGSINATSLGAIVLAGLVFGLVNLFIKPIVTLLTLPLTIITLGLSLFLVNMAMFALTAWIVDDLEVGGFWSVAGGAFIIWVVDMIINLMWGRVDVATA